MPDYSLAIHDRLSLLPLFQGLSKRELTEIVGQTRFEFARHAAGETLATEGSPSESLMFLLSGTVTIVRHSDDHSCVIEEHLAAPTLFFSEHLFGLLRRHSCTYIAREQCETLSISKTAFVLRPKEASTSRPFSLPSEIRRLIGAESGERMLTILSIAT